MSVQALAPCLDAGFPTVSAAARLLAIGIANGVTELDGLLLWFGDPAAVADRLGLADHDRLLAELVAANVLRPGFDTSALPWHLRPDTTEAGWEWLL